LPLGNDEVIAGLELILGKHIARRAPRRKSKSDDDRQIELLLIPAIEIRFAEME
jgi:hypothetical protein